MSGQTASPEQQSAIDAAVDGKNVRIMAVPGAGKTFVCMIIANKLEAQGKRVLQLTYSSPLKSEWRMKRQKEMGRELSGLQSPHSFHSFAGTLVSERIWTNDGVRKVCGYDERSLNSILVADAIIIDETQDMSDLYFNLLKWYGSCCAKRFQFIIVGQAQQCVYRYGSGGNQPKDTYANLNYLLEPTMFDDLCIPGDFKDVEFSWSFRLTPVTARFVSNLCNTSIIGMNAIENAPAPTWHICDVWDTKKCANEIEKLIRKYGENNIQIINPSLKEGGSEKPYTKLINELSTNRGYKFATKEENNEKTRRNKIIQYTCCGAKGTEADCVIVFGADAFCDGWVKEEAKFVALTRAKKELVVFQGENRKPWFVDTRCQLLNAGACVRGRMVQEKENSIPSNMISVTDLLRSSEILMKHISSLTCIRRKENDYDLVNLPNSTVSFETHSEDLTSPYGMLLPFQFCINRHNSSPADGFNNIFETIPLSGRVEDQVNKTLNHMPFPGKDEFVAKHKKRKCSRIITEEIKRHLEQHGVENSKLLQNESEFNEKFPYEKLQHLRFIRKIAPKDWSSSETMRAALSVSAYKGQHCRLNQMIHYEWADTMQHEIVCEKYLERLEKETGPTRDCTDFEKTVTWIKKNGRGEVQKIIYKNSLYHITGLKGSIDCISDKTIYEFKTKKCLEDCDRVQLFVYMLLHSYETKIPVHLLRGVLFNCMTNEKESMTIPKIDSKVDDMIMNILNIHFDEDDPEISNLFGNVRNVVIVRRDDIDNFNVPSKKAIIQEGNITARKYESLKRKAEKERHSERITGINSRNGMTESQVEKYQRTAARMFGIKVNKDQSA